MKLENFASEIKAKNHFVKASFGGFQGSGKSRTATEFIIGLYKQLGCTKPLLIIDNEKGARFLKPIFEKAGIPTLLKDTVELADVIEAFKFLNSGDLGCLFIDSLTKVWYKYCRDYRANISPSKKFMTMKDWGNVIPAWQEAFSDPFVQAEGNIVFTGRGGHQYEMEEIEQDNGRVKKEFVKSGVKMKLSGETAYEPDFNFWMQINQDMQDSGLKVWRSAVVMKDRSDCLPDVINGDGEKKGPDYSDLKPAVDFLTDQETGPVKGSSNTTNLAPKEEFDDRRKQRKIALDEIKTLFESIGLGTGAADKQIKALLAEQIWGTTSWEKLEILKIEDLQDGSLVLKIVKRYAEEGQVLHKDTLSGIVEEAKKEADPITAAFGPENELPA